MSYKTKEKNSWKVEGVFCSRGFGALITTLNVFHGGKFAGNDAVKKGVQANRRRVKEGWNEKNKIQS